MRPVDPAKPDRKVRAALYSRASGCGDGVVRLFGIRRPVATMRNACLMVYGVSLRARGATSNTSVLRNGERGGIFFPWTWHKDIGKKRDQWIELSLDW